MFSRPEFAGRSAVLLLTCSAGLLLCVSCGGGKSSASQPSQPGSSHGSSLAISCSPATVAPGAKSQCSATVDGTGNMDSAVTWSVSAGAITSSGAFTAPSSLEKVTVTATSTQDSTISGTATLT